LKNDTSSPPSSSSFIYTRVEFRANIIYEIDASRVYVSVCVCVCLCVNNDPYRRLKNNSRQRRLRIHFCAELRNVKRRRFAHVIPIRVGFIIIIVVPPDGCSVLYTASLSLSLSIHSIIVRLVIKSRFVRIR